MFDINIFVITLNIAYIIFLFAFIARKIVWLRSLTVLGYIISMPYFYFYFENPLWINLGWTSLYTVINLIMLFLIYLESRPVKFSYLEQKIYDRTFKSLKPKEFKHLMGHGSLEEFQPDVGLVSDEVDIPAGGFIGEQSFITGENTSADVSTGKEAATILSWDSDSLRKYLEKKPHLKETLELILTSDVIHKLRDMEDKYDEIKHSNDLYVK